MAALTTQTQLILLIVTAIVTAGIILDYRNWR